MADKVKLKEKQFSWITRLNNEEFTDLYNSICESISTNVRNDKDFKFIFDRMNAINQEMQSMSSIQVKHKLTKQINDLHKTRKGIISAIYLFAYLKSKDYKRNEEEIALGVISKWYLSFGKRMYDLGINKLTLKVNEMVEDINKYEYIKKAVEASRLKNFFDNLELLTAEIEEAQHKRQKDIVEKLPKYSYVEIRENAYENLKIFMNLLVSTPVRYNDSELLKSENILIDQIFKEYKSVLMKRLNHKRRKKIEDL